jgi:cell division protein FtsQ
MKRQRAPAAPGRDASPRKAAGRAADKGEGAGQPGNRRRQPAVARAPKPPRPSLRQRMRVLRERLRSAWARARRPVVATGRVLLVVAVVLGALGVGKLVERHLRTSPAFATKEVTVVGAERMSRSEVLEAAGLEVGQNAFDVGPDDARARLERHPWIAEAEVTRRLPGSFEVALREHRPAALLALDGVLYLVSDEGVAFKRAGPQDPADLPVITGISRERFSSDEELRSEVLLAAVALLHEYRSAGLWRREPVGEIHVELEDGFSIYIGDDAAMVRLGPAPHRRKLQKLRRVLDRLDAEKARPAYVYLDNVRRPDRVTVRLR